MECRMRKTATAVEKSALYIYERHLKAHYQFVIFILKIFFYGVKRMYI